MDNIPNLIRYQRKDIIKIGNYDKLDFYEIKRLDKYSKGDLFSDECVLYTGVARQQTPIFSFKGRKVSLYRLIYHNYIGNIDNEIHIGLKCPNRGKCICIKHIFKKI